MRYNVLIFLCCCILSSYAQTSYSEFTPSEMEAYNKVAKYIPDSSLIVDIVLEKGRISYVHDSTYGYYFAYTTDGDFKRIQVTNNRTGELHYYHFNKGKLTGEIFMVPTSKDWITNTIKEIFYSDSGVKLQVTEHLGGGKSKLSLYHSDDGSLDEIQNYKKSKLDGKVLTFYRSGKLKTETLFSNDKIVTLEEFEEDGKKVEATKVQNGNGYWLECSLDGGYCCECFIANGKLKNCHKFNDKKPIKKMK